MNRLRFRAWDEPNKEFLDEDTGCWLYEKDNGFHCGYNAGHKTPGVQNGDWVDCVITQAMGMKDKNGVEIYEGGIVNAYHGDFETNTIAPVSFDNGTFTIGRYWNDGKVLIWK